VLGEGGFGNIPNLKHHCEVRSDDVSIGEVVAIAKFIDELAIFSRELRIAKREQAHGFALNVT
jgi:hypothetical protein